MSKHAHPRVAFGPVMHGWGSWDWLGADLAAACRDEFEVLTFDPWRIPDAKAYFVVKHCPPDSAIPRFGDRCVIYAPVDRYGSVREIVEDGDWLGRCDRIVLHCERLREFFEPYAPVEYVDHHLKYTCEPTSWKPDGPVAWIGVRSNLPPFVEWLNEHPLPGECWVLTNPEDGRLATPEAFGFAPGRVARLEAWTPARHCEWLQFVGAVIDVKGEDFRGHHKPPVKALDYIASGLPLAMNARASAVEYLAEHGFRVAQPTEWDRWRSREYWGETQRVAEKLRPGLNLETIAQRFIAIVREAMAEVASRNGFCKSNDLGVQAALAGRIEEAAQHFADAIEHDETAGLGRENLGVLHEGRSGSVNGMLPESRRETNHANDRPRIALASFLFNWPSTGGGIVHTVELGKFLAAAGFEVKHFYARHLQHGIGRVVDPLPYEAIPIDFDNREWNADAIRAKFRAAVARYAPQRVIVTDSWNTKPLLADALKEWPYLLRFQALECLCPLNNIRLLPDGQGGVRQCTLHQLATPDECRRCVGGLGNQAGSLHQIERQVAGYGSAEYDATLRSALRNAHAVLVVNPLMEAMLSPYAAKIVVCPAGMDPERFPNPQPPPVRPDGSKRVLFAGLTEEFIKGYHVLRAAAAELWRTRQDFRIVATADPAPDALPFEEFIGWQSQTALPASMANADIVAAPAIAQEAIGRTAVEGMAAGRPVLASRIGGLPFALGEGAAGLLAEAGDAFDLAAQLATLLDDAELRARLGAAGRRRFEERFAWPGIVERQYRPLLVERSVGVAIS